MKIWSPVLVPSPLSVARYIVGALRDGTLEHASVVTMRRLLSGYALGLVFGLPLGLLTARFKVMDDTLGIIAPASPPSPPRPRSCARRTVVRPSGG